jgi:hypothetical protein
MKSSKSHERPEVLTSAPMLYAPENELGVVFLFAHLAKRWRLRIEEIQAKYPDCIAYQKIQGKEKKIRIEFEFKSKNFANHGHDPKKCDWIVCWEHNWTEAPNHLNIIELRREFGLGFNVWIMPVQEPYRESLANSNRNFWSTPSQAHKGDLILFYFTNPEKSINYIHRLSENTKKVLAEWREGEDYMASIQKVCNLKSPIFLEDLHSHRVLKTAGFVRGQMQGRPNVTEYWTYLYDLIVRRNPIVKAKLMKYSPEVLG